jgi:hypothetical protein
MKASKINWSMYTKNTDKFFFVLYALGLIILACHHEPWGDELQAWLISRDLNVWGIISQVEFDGHPALWYLILHPFAASGCSVTALPLISAILSIFAAWLLLFKSPFKSFTKYTILLSYPCLYAFPIISRNYALIPPLMFLIAYLYPKRLEKTILYCFLVGLLAHTHLYMEGVVGILFLTLLYDVVTQSRKTENRNLIKGISGLSVILVMVLLAFLQVKGGLDSNYVPHTPSISHIQQLLNNLHYISHAYVTLAHNGWLAFLIVFVLGLCACIFLYKLSRSLFWILVAGFSYQMIFAVLIYPMGNNREYLFFILLIFCCWVGTSISAKNERNVQWLVIVLLCFSVLLIPKGIKASIWDYKHEYSSEKSTGNFIDKNIPNKQTIIFAPKICQMTGVIAYANDYKWVALETGERYTYNRPSASVNDRHDIYDYQMLNILDKYSIQDCYFICETNYISDSIVRDFISSLEGEVSFVQIYESNSVKRDSYKIFKIQKQ